MKKIGIVGSAITVEMIQHLNSKDIATLATETADIDLQAIKKAQVELKCIEASLPFLPKQNHKRLPAGPYNKPKRKKK